MDNKLKVSVIMPIYNAAEFLREGLDSLLKQTLHEIEIICVNDASDDDSLMQIKMVSQNATTTSISVVNMSHFHGLELAQVRQEIMVCMLRRENIWLFWIQMIFLNLIC